MDLSRWAIRHRQKARLPARQRGARAPAPRSRSAVRRLAARAAGRTRPRVIPLERAQALILNAVAPLAPRVCNTRDARGLVLAQDVVATEPVPPFANTGMDGYAVRAADTPGTLRVIGDLPAGRAPTIPVGPGEAIRIMTGAPMPDGADAVVMVERTRADGDDGAVGDEARISESVS